jgi:hypothetical protein
MNAKVKPSLAELEQAAEKPQAIRGLAKPAKKTKLVEAPPEAAPAPPEPKTLYHPFIEFKIEIPSVRFENFDEEGNPSDETPVYYIQKNIPEALQALNDWTSGKSALLCHSTILQSLTSVSLFKPAFFGAELGRNAKVTINLMGDFKTVTNPDGSCAAKPEIIYNTTFKLG